MARVKVDTIFDEIIKILFRNHCLKEGAEFKSCDIILSTIYNKRSKLRFTNRFTNTKCLSCLGGNRSVEGVESEKTRAASILRKLEKLIVFFAKFSR